MTTLIEQAEKTLRIVREAPRVVFDVETSGLDWGCNYPVGYVIGSGNDVFYIPIRHGGGGNLPSGGEVPTPETPTDDLYIHKYERELADAFYGRNKDGGIIIGHNIKFDCHMAANAGIMLGRYLTCTMNNHALIDEYARSYSLEAVAKSYGVTPKGGDELYRYMSTVLSECPPTKDAMRHFWRLSGQDAMVQEYAVGDGISTMEVFGAQLAVIEEQGLGTIQAVENDMIWTLFKMERRGIRMDVEYLKNMSEAIDIMITNTMAELPGDFNVRSPKDVRNYVSQYRTDWPTTEKGNPSFTEAWLKKFPEGQHIVRIRKLSNVINSFIKPAMERHIRPATGRIHANFIQNKTDAGGTISGRLSCSRPNLQQVPKHDRELAPMFRRAFVADVGMTIVELDYSQCEPRLFAQYSEEPALVKGYSEKPYKDVHTIVAELFNADRGTVAKRMNMGMFTGMYPKAFAEHMELPIEEASALWDKWHQAFPLVKDFQNRAKSAMLRRGYVKTILGRRGRLESQRFAYKSVSKIIQGTNADILKYMLVQVDRELGDRGVELLGTAHDSVLVQVNSEHRDVHIGRIVKIMEDVQSPPFNLRVPFKLDYGYGPNWAVASYGGENE